MRFAGTVLVVLTAAAGCGDDSRDDGRELSAVATTAHVADLVRRVGGSRVEVHALVGQADPHGYEPRPSDARAVAEAAVVFRSGGDVDEWLDEVLDNAGEDAPEVNLIDSVRTIEDDGDTDPHWWQDPRNALLAVAAIRDSLAEADPAGRSAYARNAAAYATRLRELDRAIAACIQRVPAARRKLVTTHDSYGYFARRYGIEVVGALIPSRSTQAQPSARDTLELVEQIEREGARAIFPESALNPKLEEAVARESGAEVGAALWADSLGPEGSEGGTYAGALASDAAAIAAGLSGGEVRCRPDTPREGSRRGR